MSRYPQRIICLTEETTETLYAIGADDRIVGISGFVVRPKRARKEKPRVSTYLDAQFEEIMHLKPDIVFTWSDLQADIAAELIRRGIAVVAFNHRSVEGILNMIVQLGSILGLASAAEVYAHYLECRVQQAREIGLNRANKPKVYFEEWYDPLISGICWVSEIIELCGGVDVFVENRVHPNAKQRIIADVREPLRRDPDIMLASWCGKMFKPERVAQRPGWDAFRPLITQQMFDIPSATILQPGPAALTDGLDTIMHILGQWEEQQ